MHPRYYEGVVYLYPDENWETVPSDRPMALRDDGDGGYVTKWELEGEPPTDAEIEAALTEKDAKAAAKEEAIKQLLLDPALVDLYGKIKTLMEAKK